MSEKIPLLPLTTTDTAQDKSALKNSLKKLAIPSGHTFSSSSSSSSSIVSGF
jgi:hypothetical protein